MSIVEEEVKELGRVLAYIGLDKKRWKLRMKKVQFKNHRAIEAIRTLLSTNEIVTDKLVGGIVEVISKLPEYEGWLKYLKGFSPVIFAQIYSYIDWRKVKSCSSLASYVGIGTRSRIREMYTKKHVTEEIQAGQVSPLTGNRIAKGLVMRQASLFLGYNVPSISPLRVGKVRVKSGGYARFFQEELIKYSRLMVDGDSRFEGFKPMHLALYCLTNTAQLFLSHLTAVHFWLHRKLLMIPYSVAHAGHDWVYLPPIDNGKQPDWLKEMEEALYKKGVKPVVMENRVYSEDKMLSLLPEKYVEMVEKTRSSASL